MLTSKLVCKTCNQASDLITDAESGEIICTNCGMVNSNDKALQLNTGEWRAFDHKQMGDRSRVGM
ncbi:MAG TPA: TFIIB-type zinc ribbon-containing protein, partial [Nitrososphaeraceae archaeon]|nr:TFIIB-type zinc ribbon-containing protein [Nitrososphaeraceae archaeon]